MLDYTAFLNGSLTYGDGLRLAGRLLFRAAIDDPQHVTDYEDAVKNTIGVKHVFSTGAGRMGLFLLLKALGFGAGDEIILPGYTCVVMPNAIRFAGCKPVYVDVRKTDFNIDPKLIEAAVTPRTRAVVMQHTFGIPCDIATISKICEQHHLYLIEDAAHALGARYAGVFVGGWGVATVFSTETSKMIATDKGGLITTNEDQLASRLLALSRDLPLRDQEVETLALMRLLFRVFEHDPILRRVIFRLIKYVIHQRIQNPPESILRYDSDEYQAELDGVQGRVYPHRLSGALSLAGRWQIERLHADVAERTEKAALIQGLLKKFDILLPGFDPEVSEPSWLRFPFVVDQVEHWKSALAHIGLPTADWLNDPLHPRETRCHRLNEYYWGSCPNAEYISNHIVNLPLGRSVTLAALKKLEKLRL